jgi:cellulose synthase/poly-beta-1,6-N-acetylglucosamine synthase-like glycosyltransferase
MNKQSDTKSSSSDIILSIITVVKNDAIRLSRTVDSLKSFYENNQIEHIVVDANSYDETITILNKINLIGQDLNEYSLETVQMFRNDALKSGYQI